MDVTELPLIRDKYDCESANELVRLGYPTVAPRLGHMLEWLQDINWPVASALFDFLTGIGEPLVPHIQGILRSDDDVWKYWSLHLVAAMPSDSIAALKIDLERVALTPTDGERKEEVSAKAEEILNAHRNT